MKLIKKNPLRLLPLLSALLLCGAVLMAGGRIPQRNKDKSRYYLIEGYRLAAADKPEEAFEYYKKAWQLDSTNAEAAWEYGNMRIALRNDSLRTDKEIARNINMMRQFVNKYPGDYNEAELFAYFLMQTKAYDESASVLRNVIANNPERTSNMIDLAEVYMLQDSLEEALECLNKYEKIEGTSMKLTLQKVGYLMFHADTLRAYNELDRLIENDKTDPIPLLLKGSFISDMQGIDSAAPYLFKALEISPDNGTVKTSLANYYRIKGDSVNYDKMIYESLLAEDLDLQTKLTTLFPYLQKLIEDKSAEDRGDHLFEVLRHEYPHEDDILILSGRYHYARGDKKRAIEDLQYVVDLNSEQPAYWEELMTYELADSQMMAVRTTYGKAQKHVGGTELMKRIIAQSYMMQDSLNQAISVYEELLADTIPGFKYPDSMDDLNLLRRQNLARLDEGSNIITEMALCYSQSKMVAEAENLYKDALRLNPDNALAANNLAYSMIETHPDSLEEAERLSKVAITHQPDNMTYIDTYAWVLYKMKKYPEALEYQKKAIEMADGDDEGMEELYDHYGDILYMNQLPEEALNAWEKALELDPDNADLKKKVKQKSPIF